MSLNDEVHYVRFPLFRGGKDAPAVLFLLVSVLIKCTEESEQHAHSTESRALYSKDVWIVHFFTYTKKITIQL